MDIRLMTLRSCVARAAWLWLLLVLLAAATGAPAAWAQDRTPLLMDGKKTLFQRVLTRPGATLAASPGEADGKKVPAFSQYYVYDRKPLAGGEWLEVGSGSPGVIDGWIRAEATLPWKQQMALAFTNPAGRERTLLFEKREDVVSLIKAPDSGAAVAPIRKAVEDGPPGDPRVLSIEPETHVDILKQFYLLPILEAKEEDSGKGFKVRVLEVASVTANEDGKAPGEPTATQPTAAAPTAGAIRTFSAALVFVIDSTISMGPYIDRTRDAVKRVYNAVEEAGLTDQVRFGLVAFRSSVEATPGLEYVAKVYADPAEVKDGAAFLDRVADLEPAAVSSAKFNEDSYAGVIEAINQIKWEQFGGRYVVLISDAGAIEGSDPLSSSGLDAEQVRLELERLGIALYALHLKTPQGKRTHAQAERQYKELSTNAVTGGPIYYSVESGSVAQFGSIVDDLAASVVGQVKAASQGELVAGSARAAQKNMPPKPSPEELQARLAEDTALLGRAMQLAYLGRVQETEAPPVFRAWLSDRDFAQPERATTEVRVLLTKNQLSDMAEVVTTVLDAGEKSQQTSSADFFDLIRSAAAHLARDPAALNDPKVSNLGELGLLGEYLNDLPYQSKVLSLSRDDWVAWSLSQQEELLDSLRRKLRLYQVYNEDVDRWVALTPGADPGEMVYPVPLDALP